MRKQNVDYEKTVGFYIFLKMTSYFIRSILLFAFPMNLCYDKNNKIS